MNKLKNNSGYYFVGPEVTNTPANSKKTLFVIGQQNVDAIEDTARKNFTSHIFLGTDNSFSLDNIQYWDNTITKLLDKGFMVSLEYEAHQHEQLLKKLNAGIWQCRLFIPVLSVKIPNLQKSNPNLTIKFDDSHNTITNEGVWCLHFKEVSDSNRFTDWRDFEFESIDKSQDTIQVSNIPDTTTITITEPETTVDSESVIKNDLTAGLDLNPTTALNTDAEIDRIEKVLETTGPVVIEDAAEMYAASSVNEVQEKETKKTKVKK